MKLTKSCIYFLWIIAMMINERYAFRLQLPPKNRLSGLSAYVLDLYKSYSDASASSGQNALRLHYDEAATIRSFYNEGELLEGHMLYDVIIPKEEEIVGAELHIFIPHRIVNLLGASDNIKIQLFEVQEQESLELLEERKVLANDFGWQVFVVKSTIEKWHDRPMQNYGFNIKVLDSFEKDISSEIILNLKRDYESVLIIFTRDSNVTQLTGSQIFNNVQSLPETENLRIQLETARKIRSVSNDNRTDGDEDDNNLCQLHKLELNFADLGWTFIMYPVSFDASICKGSCDTLANAAAYHTIALSAAYKAGKISKKDGPGCGPTDYAPLRIIYEDNGSYVSKIIDKMVATDCGCR